MEPKTAAAIREVFFIFIGGIGSWSNELLRQYHEAIEARGLSERIAFGVGRAAIDPRSQPASARDRNRRSLPNAAQQTRTIFERIRVTGAGLELEPERAGRQPRAALNHRRRRRDF